MFVYVRVFSSSEILYKSEILDGPKSLRTPAVHFKLDFFIISTQWPEATVKNIED